MTYFKNFSKSYYLNMYLWHINYYKIYISFDILVVRFFLFIFYITLTIVMSFPILSYIFINIIWL